MNKAIRTSRAGTLGTGVGRGHGGNTPNLPAIRELLEENMDSRLSELIKMLQPGTRAFRMGRAKIFVSPPHNGMGWHLSISRDDRYPSWDEVAKAWYDLVPDADLRTGSMLLPPKSEYINVHKFCFQIHEMQP